MMTETENTKTKLTKTELAKRLGISRSSLYYEPKRPALDLELKGQIESVLTDHHSYGHKRIAQELGMNKKRILRVMKKFGLKPYKRRIQKPNKKGDQNRPPSKYQNLIKGWCPIRPNVVWVSDFTFIEFRGRFIYLATIMDLFTREIIGFAVSRWHNKNMILEALNMVIKREGTWPLFHHSDHGSEYESVEYTVRLEEGKTQISMSKKGSPWENGFQESFYSNFKLDFGHTNQYESLGALVEAIYLAINNYNTNRIHTSIKTNPKQFREQYERRRTKEN